MASPFFSIYTKNLSRIYYAELIDETAASASMAQQRSTSIGKSGADLSYSIATLRAPSEIEAEHRNKQDRDMAGSTCFNIPFAASDAS